MKMNFYKTGAVLYILWGVMHVMWGGTLLMKAASEGGTAALAVIASTTPAAMLPQNLDGVATGVIEQHAWNLMWFGLFAVIVAVTMNWKNSRTGYWLNLVVVSAADLGFIFAVMVPGYIPFGQGVMGPALWVLALIFTTLGIRTADAVLPISSTALG